jgi:hypothetical protein
MLMAQGWIPEERDRLTAELRKPSTVEQRTLRSSTSKC